MPTWYTGQEPFTMTDGGDSMMPTHDERNRAGQAYGLHDEAMRMQALAIGAQMSETVDGVLDAQRKLVLEQARWAYREATGREW